MKWIGQNIYDLVSKFRNTVDFSKDVTFYQPVNDADPSISLGASDDERLKIGINYQGTTTQTAQIVAFQTFTESGTAHDGRFHFVVDQSNILKIQDDGIDFFAGKGIGINGVDILTDNGSGTATLSNIDALDATTISTLNSALTAGDITGVTAGTGLSGGGTSGAVTLNVDASLSHLSSIILDVDKSVTPGDGAVIHVDAHTVTDSNTSGSGTAALYTHVKIEAPRLAATNSSVTTTAAASLYVEGAPAAHTNQTITNNYALWVDSGLVKFDGALTVGGTITGNVTGDLTGEAATVATIAGLAPNTATTQATQPNITTLAGVSAIGTAGTPIVVTSDTVTFTSASADDPTITIKNTSSGTDDMAMLNFVKDRGTAPGVGDNLAEIRFFGEDSGQNEQEYGRIFCETDVVTDGQESGKLSLGVANHDGGNGYGLILTGGSADNEIDVTVGLGASSVVTVPGVLNCSGGVSSDFTGDLTGQADTVATIAGLAPNTATTQATQAAITTCANLVTVGTITTGVWEGTAIASDQQKHLMHYQTTGFGTADGTNYDVPQQMSTNTAPFKHDNSIGADGLTAQTPQVWIRMGGGHVMPRACTLKRWTGWAASAGSGTTYLGLFKVTMTRNSSTTVSAVLLEEFSYTALGNSKLEDFDETSFTATAIAAGDIVFTAMKGVNNKTAYFNGTFEVEF